MFWNSGATCQGFRVVTDKVVYISSIHKQFGEDLFRKQRADLLIFDTFAKPSWYTTMKLYRHLTD